MHAIRRFAKDLTPAELRDQMRIDVTVDGNRVTLADGRPPWDGSSGEWTSAPFAQLRYEPATGLWSLWWGDSDDRWHRYQDPAPVTDVGVLIEEIREDPACIFFG
jgi:hypothetical protein